MVNVMINSSIKLFLKQEWFPPLKILTEKVHCRLIKLILLKFKCKETTPSIPDVLDIKQKLLFAG